MVAFKQLLFSNKDPGSGFVVVLCIHDYGLQQNPTK